MKIPFFSPWKVVPRTTGIKAVEPCFIYLKEPTSEMIDGQTVVISFKQASVHLSKTVYATMSRDTAFRPSGISVVDIRC